ncbi:MAG: sigma-E processing peptidase SpoIIGA [Faecousia sp.]
MKVYVDGVMGLNFLVDYLLLLGTNRMSGFPSEKKRLAAAAALGAVYSGVCLLPDFRFMGNTLWRLVCLGIMGSIAFGWNSSALRRCGLFVLLSFALGGFALCIGKADIRVLLLSAVGLWCLCRLCVEGSLGGREYIPLELQNGDRSVKLLALRDTGNTLRDPVTGEQALVITSSAAAKLTGLTEQQIQNPVGTMASRCLPGLRLIPFKTVGQGSGMMLAMGLDQVRMNGRSRRAVVAFAPENFGKGAAYQALTGGVVW